MVFRVKFTSYYRGGRILEDFTSTQIDSLVVKTEHDLL